MTDAKLRLAKLRLFTFDESKSDISSDHPDAPSDSSEFCE